MYASKLIVCDASKKYQTSVVFLDILNFWNQRDLWSFLKKGTWSFSLKCLKDNSQAGVIQSHCYKVKEKKNLTSEILLYLLGRSFQYKIVLKPLKV